MDDTSLRLAQLSAQGLCCSQILMQLLCEGSCGGGLCGVATGGACVLALYAARGSADEEPLDSYPLLVSEFMDWFRASAADWGGIRCDEIVSVQGGQRPEVCGAILLRARETILGLLAEQGIDPSLPREESHGF
jgi:hypothetical protein